MDQHIEKKTKDVVILSFEDNIFHLQWYLVLLTLSILNQHQWQSLEAPCINKFITQAQVWLIFHQILLSTTLMVDLLIFLVIGLKAFLKDRQKCVFPRMIRYRSASFFSTILNWHNGPTHREKTKDVRILSFEDSPSLTRRKLFSFNVRFLQFRSVDNHINLFSSLTLS